MLQFRSATNRKTLENAVKSGRLVRIASGIYSTDRRTDPATQIRLNLVKVLAYLRPGAVISHRSALHPDFGASEGVVIITDPSVPNNYIHDLPGLKVLATPGPGPLPSDADLKGIHVSSLLRAILENHEPRRILKGVGVAKAADPAEIEEFYVRQAATPLQAEGLLTGLRALAREPGFRWNVELETVEHEVRDRLEREAKRPLHLSTRIDQERVRLFESLAQQLARGIHGNERLRGEGLPDFPSRPSLEDRRFLNLAFYESYFSNYIEGTEFEPEDAHEIALDERSPQEHELARDGHDIRALYQMYADPDEFLREDRTPQEFLSNLKHWHALFGAHHDKADIRPGQFKDRANRVGNTWFTDPAQVEGTLQAAWEIGETLKHPFDKAVFRAASTVSVHPFIDGNGRITRFAASNVLGRAGKLRLMIPTVFREDYLLALSAFSKLDPIPAIRMFCRAERITASVPFDRGFADLTRWLRDRGAFKRPSEGMWRDETAPGTRSGDEQEEEGVAHRP